jgi:hypothetical protein
MLREKFNSIVAEGKSCNRQFLIMKISEDTGYTISVIPSEILDRKLDYYNLCFNDCMECISAKELGRRRQITAAVMTNKITDIKLLI